MPSIDQCIALLSSDPLLIQQGARFDHHWRHVDSRSSRHGHEFIFHHLDSGIHACLGYRKNELTILSCGPNRSCLDDPLFNRAAPDAPAPASCERPDTASFAWNPLNSNPKAIADAARWAGVASFTLEPNLDLSEREIKTRALGLGLDRLAMANQFHFSLVYSIGYDDAIRAAAAVFTSLSSLEIGELRHEHCSRALAPILPFGSEDIDASGLWSIPASSPQSLAIQLLSLGFHWDPAIQKAIDDEIDQNNLAFLLPIIDARSIIEAMGHGRPSLHHGRGPARL